MKRYIKGIAILLVSILLVGCGERIVSPNSTVSATAEQTPTVQATPKKSPEPLQTTEPTPTLAATPTPAGTTPRDVEPISVKDFNFYDADGNLTWEPKGIFPPASTVIHTPHTPETALRLYYCNSTCVQTYRGVKEGDDALEAMQKYDLSQCFFSVNGLTEDGLSYGDQYDELCETGDDLLPYFDEIFEQGQGSTITIELSRYFKDGEEKTRQEAEDAGWFENWEHIFDYDPENPKAWEWGLVFKLRDGKVKRISLHFTYISAE